MPSLSGLASAALPTIIVSVQVYQNSVSRMNRSAAWETCWAVNNAFVMKPETVPYLECVECQGRLQSNKRYSSVLMKAIEWGCGHQRSGYLCTKCDVDYLLLVTQGQQRCSNPHCKTFVKVNLEEVEDRLQRKPDILAR